MSDSPQHVVWEALKTFMPTGSATHAAHVAVTALREAGWIAGGETSHQASKLPQPEEINWSALKPEMFESG